MGFKEKVKMKEGSHLQLAILLFAIFTADINAEEIDVELSENPATNLEFNFLDAIPEHSMLASQAVKKTLLKMPELQILRSQFEFTFEHGNHSDNSTNSTQCNTDLTNLASSLKESWALPLIDSFGKPSSGILKGNSFWPGDYDECRNVEATNSTLFPSGLKGRYCIATIIPNNGTLAISTGICVPNSCSSNDLNVEYYLLLQYLNRTPIVKDYVKDFPIIKVNCLPDDSKLNGASIAFIVVISIILAFNFAGTVYDIIKRYSTKSNNFDKISNAETSNHETEESSNGENSLVNEDTIQPINDKEQDTDVLVPEVGTGRKWLDEVLLCFSALKNGEAILDTSQKSGQLNCLHGIRFISMTWVILGHTYVFGIGQMTNVIDLLKRFDDWTFLGITNAQFSVDTFFLLSGFLMTYLFLKDRSILTPMKIGVFYLHRYIRLTPVYMVVVFAYATVFNFIGDGPYWPYQDRDSNVCTKYFWRNLLYINNFGPTESCAGWAWYLANDMQFFVISPIFLVFLKSPRRKWRYIGGCIILVLLIASWISTAIIVVVNKITLPAFLEGHIDILHIDPAALGAGDMFEDIYVKPWTRIGPYLIGCLLGAVYLEFGGIRNFFSTIWNLGLWSAAVGLALIDVYGVHNANFGLTTAAFYYALSRSAWVIAVGWVIFACLTGHGGPVDKFLSWKLWIPLSRLTYCAYLTHPLIIYYYFLSLRTPVAISNAFVAVHYLGFTVLTYGLAFVTSIAFESPVIRLEKLIRESLTRR